MYLAELISKLNHVYETTDGDIQVEFARGGDGLMDASEFHSFDEVVLVEGVSNVGAQTSHQTTLYLVQT